MEVDPIKKAALPFFPLGELLPLRELIPFGEFPPFGAVRRRFLAVFLRILKITPVFRYCVQDKASLCSSFLCKADISVIMILQRYSEMITHAIHILFVVYTERKNRIRLISARPANRTERSLYYDRNL